ncbi:MAG: accessory gene regulator B family protein [Bacilli bacterium]|nr:accessory gene regulator B family protein [Bacilli bacterium]
MKEKFVNGLTNFITKNKDCDELKIKTIRYGLEGLYLSVTKFIVIFIIVIICNTLIEYLLLLVFYLLIRKYSFGLHATSSLACWLTTLPIYVGGSLIIKYCIFNHYIPYVVWLFAFISFVLWAPADTPKRPLIRKKQRKVQKLKTCIICFIYLIILIFSNNSTLNNAIIISLIVQAVMINPLIYKLTRTRFNNYQYYPNKV